MRALWNLFVFALAVAFCWLALWDDVLPPGWRQDVLAATAHPNAWPVAMMLAGAMLTLAAWAALVDQQDALRKEAEAAQTWHVGKRRKLLNSCWWRLPLVMRWGLGLLAVPVALPPAILLGQGLEQWYGLWAVPAEWASSLEAAVHVTAVATPILFPALCAWLAGYYGGVVAKLWRPLNDSDLYAY